MAKLILMRHGECVWHRGNIFTGWIDVPLSSNGIIEALKTGTRISEIEFDIVATSMQIRAVEAAMIALTQNKGKKIPVLVPDSEKIGDWTAINNDSMEGGIIPVFRNRNLNEQCALRAGSRIIISGEQVAEGINEWCHNYDRPLQNMECLRDTASRTIPFFMENIIPQLERGKNVLISAHDSSLRPLVMFIEDITEEAIFGIEILTWSPLFYDYNDLKLSRME